MTEDQLMNIDLAVESGQRAAGFSDAPNIRALAAPMLAPSASRACGAHAVQPVLLCARPGTGKTWSSMQLVHELAKRAQAKARAEQVKSG